MIESLGGKSAFSPIVQREIAELRALGAEIAALGPIDTVEQATKYRALKVRHAKGEDRNKLIQFFHEFNLPYIRLEKESN